MGTDHEASGYEEQRGSVKIVEVRPIDPDSSLIERARQGDQQAFAELVRRYQAVAFRVAYVITGSPEDAEDVAQEGFVRAYRALDRFRLHSPFRPWLLRIVANVARSRRSRAVRMSTLTLDEAPPDRRVADDSLSPESVVLTEEDLERLLKAVRSLRIEDQRIIALRYFHELSEAEMAAVLNCARGTVKSRLSRALGRLRATLQPAMARDQHE